MYIGMALAFKEAFIMLGLLLGYTLGYLFSETTGGWAIMYVMSLPVSIIIFIVMSTLPHSFQWLAAKNMQSEAISSIRVIYPDITSLQVHEHLNAVTNIADTYRVDMNCCVRLSTPKTFTSLIIAILLVAFQQFSGQPTILYYLNTVLQNLNVSHLSTIWISAIMFVTTLVSPWLVDRVGRKLMLGIGCIVMLLMLMIAGTILSVAEVNSFDMSIIGVCLCLYIVGYEIGFGPITWLLAAELSPTESKELIIAVTTLINIFCNFFVTNMFPLEVEQIGVANIFFLYSAVIFACLLFLSTNIIPETKGLTLEGIERLMVQRWSPSSYTYLDIDEH
jgi:SP family arabinose:H+ symporter-like MFS transporter